MKTNLVVLLPGATKGAPGSLIDAVDAAARSWYKEHAPHLVNYVAVDVALVPESDTDRAEADRIAGRSPLSPRPFGPIR